MAEWAQVTWDAGLKYKAFYLPEQRRLHVLSDVLADEETSVEIPGLGVLLLDENREFRAAEFHLAGAGERQVPLTIPVAAHVWKDRFLSNVSSASEPKWDYDQQSGYCRVQLREGVEDHWLQLGDDAQLWLGADEQQRLTGIAIGGIEPDSDGRGEAAWIEELLADE